MTTTKIKPRKKRKLINLRTSQITPKWKKLFKHKGQRSYMLDLIGRWTRIDGELRLIKKGKRYNVNPSGRRSGKTEYGKRAICWAAILCDRHSMMLDGSDRPENPFFVMAAPTRDQAKKIYWNDLKKMIPKAYTLSISETELSVTLTHGTKVAVVGMDRPERIEGAPLHGFLGTEYGNFKEEAYNEHIRPALSTIGEEGFFWGEGTPEGRNHWFDMVQRALESPEKWGYNHWPSWELLNPEEIEEAKEGMDELAFRQEYGGEFINFAGRAYHAFSDELNVSKAAEYDPNRPLDLCFDFNVDPGVCAMAQAIPNPEKIRKDMAGTVSSYFDEVYIPRNSNTPKVCEYVARKVKKLGHTGTIRIFADASGGARHTSQTKGSDLDLIRDVLSELLGANRIRFHVKKSNPAIRSRLNAVNSRCRAMNGTVALLVNPRCKHLIKDLNGVSLDSKGDIDKKIAKHLTHISDGAGYREAELYPIVKNVVRSRSIM